mgnify:CR=1 FL=1
MIRLMREEEIPACVALIRRSFGTVAEEFALTRENCPRHTSFMPIYFLETQMEWGWHMYGLYNDSKIIGYITKNC